MTVAHVPIIDLELEDYRRYMESRKHIQFADKQIAYDTLLYTARWLDKAQILEPRSLEGSLLRTVEM